MEETRTDFGLKESTDIRELNAKQLHGLTAKYEWFGCAQRLLARGGAQTARAYLLCDLFDGHNQAALKKLTAEEFALGENINTTLGADMDATSADGTSAAEERQTFGFDFSQTDSIIDSFINSGAEHKIAARDDTPDLAINDFADSQDVDDGIATEELAEIYRKQGLYQQALTIYRKLSLLNPKKSVYFAEIIAEIEKNINN